MPSPAQALLTQTFGFSEFKPGQQAVVEHLLAGRNAAAVFPTGGGKSLCYQLPALALPGVTLVVSPLIALMKDQIDALRAKGVAAERLDSTLSAERYREVMGAVRSGTLRLLYVAPERFNNERFREALLHARVSLFAVDEAHCISEWGHNFRPDYLKLAQFAEHCRAERVLALTATATPRVLDDICRVLRIEPRCAVRTGFYRPNLALLATPTSASQRDLRLISRLRERPAGPTIVYVTLQKTATQLAERLVAEGFPARAYHAGLEDEVRAAVQDEFLASPRALVVATIAFGMGIDKSNIRYVYHYNLPKSLENYAQEIGRSGRDGQSATCELLACEHDLNVLENFIYGDTPCLSAVEGLVEDVFGQGAEFHVSLHELSHRYDIRDLVVRTLLTYLELDGFLAGGTPFYASYQFQPRVSSGEILSRFAGERREFLRLLLAQAKKAKTWFSLDLDQAARATNSERGRVVAALDYLGEQQLLHLKVAGARSRYTLKKRPGEFKPLAESLFGRLLAREQGELKRLQQVLAFAGSGHCLARLLGAHFGEELPRDCGHCTPCLERRAPISWERPAPVIEIGLARDLDTLRRKEPEALGQARAAARFLCGVSSPRLSRAKLMGHFLCGRLAHVPFRNVLAWVEQLPVGERH